MQLIVGLILITFPIWDHLLLPYVRIVMDGLVRIADKIRKFHRD